MSSSSARGYAVGCLVLGIVLGSSISWVIMQTILLSKPAQQRQVPSIQAPGWSCLYGASGASVCVYQGLL